MRNIRVVLFNGKYAFEPLGVGEVEPVDLDYILNLRSRGGGCCGSNSPGGEPLFALED